MTINQPDQSDAKTVGLCCNCIHAKIIQNRRSSRFFLCDLAQKNPAFPKYPRLLVLNCAKHKAVKP